MWLASTKLIMKKHSERMQIQTELMSMQSRDSQELKSNDFQSKTSNNDSASSLELYKKFWEEVAFCSSGSQQQCFFGFLTAINMS